MTRRRVDPPDFPPAVASAPFPDTRSEVLAEAACGNWTRFLRDYLAPCWREIVLVCRSRGLPVDEAPDLLQELAVRLLRESPFKDEPAPRANLPGRFLRNRQRGLPSARFRTYLKKVIHNLVLEQLRQKQRQPRVTPADGLPEPWVEDSISQSVDRSWVASCLVEAARQLQQESQTARTRGQRRLFVILSLSTVQGWSGTRIATKLGLDRSTVADLLAQARQRFVQILGQISGIQSQDELLGHVAADPEALIQALALVSGAAAEKKETEN
ncbi:MAG: sigma-70 family RNA polymerase sigma factor [Gemmataceae bacterium]|nr:sigma-70 family RNA polymerase sigma factor [Gemmataceae bacterium]